MAPDFSEVGADLLPSKRTGKKDSLRESSIGPIIVPTPGTVLFRYCHSRWSNPPKSAYAN